MQELQLRLFSCKNISQIGFSLKSRKKSFTTFAAFSSFASSFYFDCSEVKIGNSRFFIKTSSFNLRLLFVISCQNIENWDFPLQVCSTSCSIRQYQCFFKNNVFWDIEMLQCNSGLGCSDKLHSHNKNICSLFNKKYLEGSKRYMLSLYFS